MFWNKKKGSAGEDLVIFFASDLHGSAVCFKKFVNGAKFYGANLLVMGGDLTGKAVIPITEQTDGTFKSFQTGAEVTIDSRDELDEFIKRVDNQGFYPTVMTEAEFQVSRGCPAMSEPGRVGPVRRDTPRLCDPLRGRATRSAPH